MISSICLSTLRCVTDVLHVNYSLPFSTKSQAQVSQEQIEARTLCGTAWTNRLAALFPDDWCLGACI